MDIKTTLDAALEAQRNLEAALEDARNTSRQIAVRWLREAQTACLLVGATTTTKIAAKPKRRSLSPETRSRYSEAAKARWAVKTTEERAAWAANINRKREAKRA